MKIAFGSTSVGLPGESFHILVKLAATSRVTLISCFLKNHCSGCRCHLALQISFPVHLSVKASQRKSWMYSGTEQNQQIPQVRNSCTVNLPHCLISPGAYFFKSSVMFSRHLPTVCADKGMRLSSGTNLCSMDFFPRLLSLQQEEQVFLPQYGTFSCLLLIKNL